MSLVLEDGLLVGLATGEQLAGARKACRNRDNTMFTPAEPDGSIPWRDEFFSKVFAPDQEELNAEIMRVLIPGGLAYLATGTYSRPQPV